MIHAHVVQEKSIKNAMENKNRMEGDNSKLENRESEINELIKNLAEREEMSPDDIMSDIATFAPYEENDSANPDYIDQVAEMIGITSEELSQYAIKKARGY